MDHDSPPPRNASVTQSPPEVTLLLDDLFQTSHVLGQELDVLAALVRHPDYRLAETARWKNLVSELCVLDALLIDAARHVKHCCALYQSPAAPKESI